MIATTGNVAKTAAPSRRTAWRQVVAAGAAASIGAFPPLVPLLSTDRFTISAAAVRLRCRSCRGAGCALGSRHGGLLAVCAWIACAGRRSGWSASAAIAAEWFRFVVTASLAAATASILACPRPWRVAMRPVLILILLLCALPASAAPDAKAAPAVALHALFETEWERGLRENPVSASLRGDRRWNDRWRDDSEEAHQRRLQDDRAALAALAQIDRSALGDSDRVSYDMFAWELEGRIAGARFRTHLVPLNQRGGVQTLDSIVDSLRFASAVDFEDWNARLRGIGAVVDTTIALMRQGIEEGRVPPRVTMQRIPPQIASQIVDEATASRFYRPFVSLPDAIDAATAARLRAAAVEAITEVVVPAYRRFHAFFVDEYLPAARDSIAARELPDGEALYGHLAGRYTTTTLTPEQIHEIGLQEVARIRAEMDRVIAKVGFDGTFTEFLDFLRSDPRFYHDSPEALFESYLAIAKRIDPELVKVFHLRGIPRMPYGLRPIPDNIAPDTTTAYYSRPADDGSRAGYYYVNLYRPEVRPKYEMMVLSIHEAVPGHHFQIARTQELTDLPRFRRSASITAYVEGWALYSERLGHEMGLYDDAYDHFGQLTYDMWRAVRLVVDTGIHHKGWSRQQAIDFFRANAAKTEADIVNEIDRYIAWPGQALAYKIGQMKISELRERAERTLGERFDLRDFHEVVLDQGALPLQVLEQRVDGWLAAQKTKAGP
jgi:uncharacterized protein (DUF885 family)